jgi:CMP-N-acetylneuraminic acid synthetase
MKGESERVPGKNLRDFCGEPLLCRVLDTLQHHNGVSRIVVNTDGERIARLASEFAKVVIHERPPTLRGHDVPMNAVLAHDLQLLGEGHYLQTHVTNPMLTGATVTEAIDRYFASLPEHDSLFSVITHQSRFFDSEQRALNHDPAVLLNTQDLAPLYEENSCLYLFSHASFFGNQMNRIGRRHALYAMSKLESIDIDTEEDFRLAELAWKAFRGQSHE